MAGTIGSVVNRARYKEILVAHGLGLVLGALVMAFALYLMGLIVAPAVDRVPLLQVATGIILAAWALRSLGVSDVPFPYSNWQVPEQWRYTLPPPVTLFAYGFLLGLGWLTFPVYPIYWLLVGGTLLLGSLPIAIAAWLLYATVRLLAAWRGARLVIGGIEDVTPPAAVATRLSVAAILALTATALILNAA